MIMNWRMNPICQSLGPVQQGGIDIVARDTDLGNVIEEVVQQNLSRQHRQEGQKSDAPAMLNMLPKFELVP